VNRPAAPSATYRLQISAEFSLLDAAAVTGYLAELGVGAVYLSPLLRSTSGSPHGYDVVDHRLVDPARGGDAALAALAQACHSAGLGMVVDIVPNHMGVAVPPENHAWWDVLRLGQGSPFACWFDIDWQANAGKILVPVLGDKADPATDLRIAGEELQYFEHRYPIAPGTGQGSAAAVLERQHYKLVSFRAADTQQNYRRFFAETELAGLRVEDPAVFDATHAEILRWVSDYGVTGLRVDHPDGLADPGGYLQRLADVAPRCWITVEKIAQRGEHLPSAWPVAGMTGYDALGQVNALLIDPGAEDAMTRLYVELTGDVRDFEQQMADGKRMVITTILRAELLRLARLVPDVDDAVAALTELAVAFPVYRSYLPIGAEHLTEAIRRALVVQPGLAPSIEALLPRLCDPTDELCVRFQQLTGAIMAKGVEDTAYYRYTRFIGLNEVGGYPADFGSGLTEFHDAQQRRATTSPMGMTALSTHDTKRGEDIRARLAVLAELAQEWGETARALMALAPVPNAAFGYLLWQTAIALPALRATPLPGSELQASVGSPTDRKRSRLHAYADKAMREASDGTGWVDGNMDFEAVVHAAVDAAYDNPQMQALITDLSNRIEPHGWANSLSQKVIQLTMPGVPDVYQGSELWEDSLVDPDNRRPVDFAFRHAALIALTGPPVLDDTALAKLWVVSRALRARREHPELFTGYTPLMVSGPRREHLVAFDRGGAITLATRLPVGLSAAGGWGDSSLLLPPGQYRDVFTGSSFADQLPVASAMREYPTALLLREQP
jgi:(1->4)-alpha-D-glucan 1-alpha-D-glucosylmutase